MSQPGIVRPSRSANGVFKTAYRSGNRPCCRERALLARRLCCCNSRSRTCWDAIGSAPYQNRARHYLGAEDEPDELHRRIADITQHYSASMSELTGRLHLLSLAGEDAILGRPERTGSIQPTPLFSRLMEAACDIRPILIGIDTSSDVFAGEENNRSQVRQFVGLLRKLAIQSNSALVLSAHPSLTGINNGSGLSGSTGWHNSSVPGCT